MTPDQIRQIAEEYREDIINRMGIPKDFISADVRKGLAGDCTAILNWLNTRYCLVERSKVVELYNDIDSDARCIAEYDNKVLNDYDVYDYFHSLFGSETFNKKEE